jgi:hypothetical protein
VLTLNTRRIAVELAGKPLDSALLDAFAEQVRRSASAATSAADQAMSAVPSQHSVRAGTIDDFSAYECGRFQRAKQGAIVT